MDFQATALILFFGDESEFTIPNTIERLCEGCFLRSLHLRKVTFESGSQLSCIETFGFSGCELLASICIPASVKTIGKRCFFGCLALSTVIFEADSTLTCLGPGVFDQCPRLVSIVIPASLQTILREWQRLLKVIPPKATA
jgi:hypothetical protein